MEDRKLDRFMIYLVELTGFECMPQLQVQDSAPISNLGMFTTDVILQNLEC